MNTRLASSFCGALALLALLSTAAVAQSAKKPITQDTYDTWHNLTGSSISPNADSTSIFNPAAAQFSADGHYVAFLQYGTNAQFDAAGRRRATREYASRHSPLAGQCLFAIRRSLASVYSPFAARWPVPIRHSPQFYLAPISRGVTVLR